MKKYAFFLPQFHRIKENDEWWGDGFTEWVNVKKAKPLFNSHKQPKVPLDGYYNLLDKTTVKKQTSLLDNYNIDGLIYYHYYFCGKKLLEKPAENLLKWKDIKQNFFFCWANHSWIKSLNGCSEIIQEQLYGKIDDWEKHFDYLIQFFKDERYVKKDNRPLFMIYKSSFDEKVDMFNFFDKKCKENGFDGIYIINSYNYLNEDYLELNENINYKRLIFFREPTFSTFAYRNFFVKVKEKIQMIINPNHLKIYDGNKLIKSGIRKMIKGSNVVHGLFFAWDNTPRHGRRGYIINQISEKALYRYLDLIKNEEFVFINAWNEWAEGMMLEGTEENGYQYLEWLKKYDEK